MYATASDQYWLPAIGQPVPSEFTVERILSPVELLARASGTDEPPPYSPEDLYRVTCSGWIEDHAIWIGRQVLERRLRARGKTNRVYLYDTDRDWLGRIGGSSESSLPQPFLIDLDRRDAMIARAVVLLTEAGWQVESRRLGWWMGKFHQRANPPHYDYNNVRGRPFFMFQLGPDLTFSVPERRRGLRAPQSMPDTTESAKAPVFGPAETVRWLNSI